MRFPWFLFLALNVIHRVSPVKSKQIWRGSGRGLAAEIGYSSTALVARSDADASLSWHSRSIGPDSSSQETRHDRLRSGNSASPAEDQDGAQRDVEGSSSVLRNSALQRSTSEGMKDHGIVVTEPND